MIKSKYLVFIFSSILPLLLLFGGYNLNRAFGIIVSVREIFIILFSIPFFLYLINLFYKHERIKINFLIAGGYIVIYFFIGIIINFINQGDFLYLAFLQFIYFILFFIVLYVLVSNGNKYYNIFASYIISVVFFLNLIVLGLYYVILDIFIPGMTYNNGYFYISDFWGRYQFLYAEPSYAGFAFGMFAIASLLEFKYFFIKLLFFILFFISLILTQAKFALIAFVMSIILALFIKYVNIRIRINNYLLFLTIFFFLILLICIPYFIENYFFNYIYIHKEFEETGTFASRIGLFFISMRHLLYYPFGAGFAGYMTSSYPFMIDFIGNYNYLDLSEFNTFLYKGFDNKDTLGYLSFIFGIPGIIIYVYIFFKLIRQSTSFRFLFLVLFYFISSFVYINIFVLFVSNYFLGYILYKRLQYE